MEPEDPESIADAAAAWLARRDRGLSAEERRLLDAWLAEDSRHGAELARLTATWDFADRARGSTEFARRARGSRVLPSALTWAGVLAAAAAMVVGFWTFRTRPVSPSAAASYRVLPADDRTMTLDDGSVVDVKSGGEFSADYSPAIRRVFLRRGEAHFAVAKNPARPFIVSLGAVSVRALGTAFDIRLVPAEIDVLVTKGRVAVEDGRGGAYPPAALLAAGQRASIHLTADGIPGRVAVDAPTSAEIDRRLAWRSTWLVFDGTPLASAVDAFNRNGPHRLTLADGELGRRRLGGTFRADNVDAFVRLLRDSLEIRSQAQPDGTILLLPEH